VSLCVEKTFLRNPKKWIALFTEVSRRSASTTWHYLKALYNKADEDNIFVLASGIAFDFFISIIPFNLILFSILGLYLSSEEVMKNIDNYLDTVLALPEALKANLKSTVFSRISEITGSITVTAIIGVLGLLWTASGLMSTMRSALDKVFKLDISVSYFKSKLKDIGTVFVLSFLFIISFSMTSMFSVVQTLDEKFLLGILKVTRILNILPVLLGVWFSYMMFYLIFRILPRKAIGKKTARLSAIWCAVLWEILKLALTIYVVRFSNYAAIYGAYAAIAVLILWIYYSAVVFVIGAEIGQVHNERKMLMNL